MPIPSWTLAAVNQHVGAEAFTIGKLALAAATQWPLLTAHYRSAWVGALLGLWADESSRMSGP